jgi:tetratricopeptide (TPR) repeat protein
MPGALNNRVICYLGDSEGAIAHFRKAIELNPQFDRAFNNLGNALLESGELEQAIESFTTALSHDANNVEYHNNLGIALRDDNRLQDAIKHFNIAISKSEDNPVHEIWDNLATTYQRSQQLPEAIEAYKHAIAASKKAKQPRKDLYGYLMSAMQDARREADVKAVIDDAIRTFPNDAEILSIIASFKRDYGDQNQFRAYAKLAVDANPQDWHGWAQMGLADADDENFAEAAAKFERAAALTKRKNPQVLVWLGSST